MKHSWERCKDNKTCSNRSCGHGFNGKVQMSLFAYSGESEDLPLLSIPDALIQCVEGCEAELRPQLLANIVLSGANTKFPGFEKRLEKELRKRAPEAEICIRKTMIDFQKTNEDDEIEAATPEMQSSGTTTSVEYPSLPPPMASAEEEVDRQLMAFRGAARIAMVPELWENAAVPEEEEEEGLEGKSTGKRVIGQGGVKKCAIM